MSRWYYAHAGTQHGPVSEMELRSLAASGAFDPATDLVWRDGMTEWKPAASVGELSFPTAPGTTPPAPPPASTTGLNPYAAPAAQSLPAPAAPGEEIEPGSQPLDIGTCISRGFELTKRNLGLVVGAAAIYFGITIGFSMVIGTVDAVFGINNASGMAVDPETGEVDFASGYNLTPARIAVSVVTNLASWLLTAYLALGATRLALNLVDGRPANIAMLFGESSKLLRAFGAGFIYFLAIVLGLILFIAPGLIIAVRWGQYMNAIVERDMGVFDSLKYSMRLTSGNGLPLFALYIISFLIMIVGLLFCLVGAIFTYPVGFLILIVAYRWLQFGPVAATDRHA